MLAQPYSAVLGKPRNVRIAATVMSAMPVGPTRRFLARGPAAAWRTTGCLRRARRSAGTWFPLQFLTSSTGLAAVISSLMFVFRTPGFVALGVRDGVVSAQLHEALVQGLGDHLAVVRARLKGAI